MTGSSRIVATVADLGLTTHRGPDWAVHDIADTLAAAGGGDPELLAGHPGVLAAADQLAARIDADLPPGCHLIGDAIHAPAGADPVELADQAMRWKERAAYAELVADTGLWPPPDIDDAPQVRIEGRADRITPSGQHISRLAAVADVEYWGVYAVGPDHLADWHADFATLTDARHFSQRWQRPITLVCTDHLAVIGARLDSKPGQALGARVVADGPSAWLDPLQAQTAATGVDAQPPGAPDRLAM